MKILLIGLHIVALKKAKSIDLFLFNSLNYPKSYNAFDSLVEAIKYLETKQKLCQIIEFY